MKDPNKHGVYWIVKKKEKIEYGLICVAEDESYAGVIKDALTEITKDSPIQYIISTDCPFEKLKS